MVAGKVIGWKCDVAIRKASENPILDTRVYKVDFVDGGQAEFRTNVITENMYVQCDIDGNQHMLMDSTVDHKTDKTAVSNFNQFFMFNGK